MVWFCLVYLVGFVYFGLFSYRIEDDLKIKSTREDMMDLANDNLVKYDLKIKSTCLKEFFF